MKSCTSVRKYSILVARTSWAAIGALLSRVTPRPGAVRIRRNPIARIISTPARGRLLLASKNCPSRAGGANFNVTDDSASGLMLVVFIFLQAAIRGRARCRHRYAIAAGRRLGRKCAIDVLVACDLGVAVDHGSLDFIRRN
jgi:hypothetical protein